MMMMVMRRMRWIIMSTINIMKDKRSAAEELHFLLARNISTAPFFTLLKIVAGKFPFLLGAPPSGPLFVAPTLLTAPPRPILTDFPQICSNNLSSPSLSSLYHCQCHHHHHRPLLIIIRGIIIIIILVGRYFQTFLNPSGILKT